jgi:hypothetical protein
MAKKTTPKVEAQVGIVAVEQAPVFTPCAQCSYPADCARAAKCLKGFK